MNIFNIGVEYLKKNIPCLNKNWCEFEQSYFVKPSYTSLDNAFFEVPNSMYSQRRGSYLQYGKNESLILSVLHGNSNQKTCDFNYISKTYGGDYFKLVGDLQKKIGFKIENEKPNRNSWVIFSKSICNSAEFLSQFKDYNDLVSYCTKTDPLERLKVAESIGKQKGAGSSQLVMTLNWLKDIGMAGYCKPDIHLCRIITGIFKDEFLKKGRPYTSTNEEKWADELPKNVKVQKDVFIKAILQSDKDGVDLFDFDRLLYLIGSGEFYGADELSKKMKMEYAASVHGLDKDSLFIHYVLNNK